MSFDKKTYQREYQREYHRRRSAEDPEYRARRRAQQREYRRKRRADDLEGTRKHFRDWDRLRRYGITPEEYDALLTAQGGSCAICAAAPGDRPLYVDHCHVTKVVRGLLCNSCNVALGHLRDDPVLLQRAVLYLAG